MGFADCKEIAIRVSGEIPDSLICYGLYAPTSPRSSWDQRWNRWGDPVFTHFWVQKGLVIHDHAVDQFGETETNYSIYDKRYIKVGIYDPNNDKHIPLVNDPVIEWDTITGPGGSVIVRWNGYYGFKEKFDKFQENSQ